MKVPIRAARRRLLEKYRTLIALRERRDAVEASGVDWSEEEGAGRRAAFRKLSEEFPGSLRELELPAAVLAGRAAEIEEELRGGPGRAWVRVMLAYHERLGQLLAAKGWLARWIGPRGEVTDEVAGGLSAFLGRAVSRAEAEELHHPPGGRVVELVWRELEAAEGMSREALRGLILLKA